MKKIFFSCALIAGVVLSSFSQTCTADTSCSFTQTLCASNQSSGCVGEAYNQVLTIAVPANFTSVRLTNLTGLPSGLTRVCNPSNCTWNGGTRGCILVNGTPTTAGSYPLTAYVRITIFIFTKDTVFSAGTLVIDPVCYVDISGKISSEKGDSIQGVVLSLTGSATQQYTTGSNGRYIFSVPKGGSYTITPAKNNDVAKTNGISAIDLGLIQKHILIMDTLDTPYRIIASDVNATNSVSAADIGLVKRVILSVDTTFAGGKLWAFVRSNYSFPNPLNPFPFDKTRTYTNLVVDTANQNFIGVKLGDANANWNPTIP